MLDKLTNAYQKIILPNIYKNEDYSEIRKVKFLNFTCTLSFLIALFATCYTIYKQDWVSSTVNFIWSLFLVLIVYLNGKKKINLTRWVFLLFWFGYVTINVFYLNQIYYLQYYLILSILLSFILFDSFLFQILLFVFLLMVYLQIDVRSVAFINHTIRFTAFFIVAAFFKAVILEVEEKIRTSLKRAMESERQQAEDQQRLIEAELTNKNQELVNLAVYITQKNELLEELKRQLTEDKPEEDQLREIKEVIKTNESISSDREEFETYVQHVYEGFFSRLDAAFPDLTSNDKKLAALIRLNLSSKEISTVLNISPKSVDMSRYRLKKKMNLQSSMNLTEVLQSI